MNYSGTGYKASFESQSLALAALLKFTFMPGNLLIAPFDGVYFVMPLGQLKANSDVNRDVSFDANIPAFPFNGKIFFVAP